MAVVALDDYKVKVIKAKPSTGGRQRFKKAYLEDDVYDPGRTLGGEETDNEDESLVGVTKGITHSEVKALIKEDKSTIQKETEPVVTKLEASPPKDNIWAAFLERRQRRQTDMTGKAEINKRQSKRKRTDMASDIQSYGAGPVQAEDAAEESAAKNDGTVHKRTRKLSPKEVHNGDGLESGPDEGVVLGAKRRKHDE